MERAREVGFAGRNPLCPPCPLWFKLFSGPLTGVMARLSNALIALLLATTAFAQVIDTHTTVRHHREAVVDQPAEIAQAENAIQKNDFAAAEMLLKKALDR